MIYCNYTHTHFTESHCHKNTAQKLLNLYLKHTARVINSNSQDLYDSENGNGNILEKAAVSEYQNVTAIHLLIFHLISKHCSLPRVEHEYLEMG